MKSIFIYSFVQLRKNNTYSASLLQRKDYVIIYYGNIVMPQGETSLRGKLLYSCSPPSLVEFTTELQIER